MRNLFYYLVRFFGCHPIWLASRPIVLHRERSRIKGPYILVSTHLSPYDVACLICQTPKVLDFMSVVEVFRHPLARWFFKSMHAVPLDRSKRDSLTVRTIVERLKEGRVVALFPEGNIRTEETSVLNGGRLKPGVARIARMASVPILPCVVIGATGYHTLANWLPYRRIRYGLIYGEPFVVADETDTEPKVFEPRLRQIFLDLNAELRKAMNLPEIARQVSETEKL